MAKYESHPSRVPRDMDYSELHFNNVQLFKLVSSAEIILRHLYDLVPVENRSFIDQWFCFKQEFDETCSSNTNFDVNENVRESPVLARIDEVSENEKISSSASVSSSSSSESNISLESVKEENLPASVSKVSAKSLETITEKEDNQMSQIDSDLLEYMSEFKLFSDGFVSDWFKTFSFTTSEVREYINWLDNKDYKRIWANIYNNACRNNALKEIYRLNEKPTSLNISHVGKTFIPLDASHNQMSSFDETAEVRKPSLQDAANIDDHIRNLYKARNSLLHLREQLNNKLKKEEIKSSEDIKYDMKIHVAFEIIDISIEMKNQLKLGRVIQDLNRFNDKMDELIADCLSVMSRREMRCLFMTYLSNIIDMRKTCSEYDKHLLQLDSDLSNQKFLIWRMYMMMNENKRVYQSECLTLHKQFEQKLHLMGKTTTDESNDESDVRLQGQKLLSIAEKNDLQDSSHSDIKGTKNLQNVIACAPHIPQKSWKTLQNTSASSGTKVTLKKKKLIIQTQRH